MASYDPALRTRTAARIVGPYLILVAIALVLRRETLPSFFSAFMQNDALVFVAGAFTLMAGLTLLALHHHWSGISASFISLVAVLATVKGASLIIAPQFGSELTAQVTDTPAILIGAIAFEAVAGAWLSFVGWLPRRLS